MKLSFTYSGHSSNWDTYTSDNPDWYASALWKDWRYTSGPDGQRTRVNMRPAQYTVTVHHLGAKKWQEVARFEYTPSRNPKDMHLPDRTITRLIRRHLADNYRPYRLLGDDILDQRGDKVGFVVALPSGELVPSPLEAVLGSDLLRYRGWSSRELLLDAINAGATWPRTTFEEGNEHE